jgi:RNA polymerase sigma-70 factor (ECF subfamily)
MPLDASETRDLLCRAGDGDGAAVEELLAKHRARLCRMVDLRMDPRLSPRLDASDVVQEALADAARRLPDYARQRPCAFYPWLRQIALDRLVDLHRRHVQARRRSVTREASRDMRLSNASTLLLADRFAASATSVMGRLVREELHQRLRSALDDLTSSEREVVVMRHLEELSLAEVGEVLGISVEAARSRYRRAIERLHDLLDDGSEGGR